MWHVTIVIVLLLYSLCLCQEDILVSTKQGLIRGLRVKQTVQYLGIPYANPPVGNLRFHAPQTPPDSWSGIRNSKQPQSCTQNSALTRLADTSEDCLYLNVYVPNTSRQKLPVMLWIHGGVFKTGSLSGYDGASLTNSPWTGQEQIVVTINYRLGVFGFLATNQLRNRDGTSGNYGLLDQQAAMLWVSENIFSFGGDPSALTIVGESAGGFSVLVHLATRAQQEPYFRGAVVQSGVIIDFDAIPWEEAVQTGQEILNQANCTDVDCLRKVDAKTLLSISDHHKTRPTVDGMFLSRPVMDSIRDGDFNKVPIIIGSTKSEFSDFFCNSRYTANMTMANVTNTLYDVYGRRDGGVVLQYYDFSDYPTTRDALIDIYADMTVHCPTKKAASYLSKFTDTYFYTFERDVDALNSSCLGAYHNVDGTYLFPSLLARKGVELTHDEEWTSSYIQSLWLMFSNTPDEPTGKIQNLPTWTKFDSVMQNELVINDRNESIIRTQYYDRVCEMWDEPYKQMLITMGVVMGAFSLGIVMIVLVCVVPYFVTKWRLYQTKKKESVQYEELVE